MDLKTITTLTDLKIDSVAYIILFLIPGFIFYKVAARYIIHEKYDGSEKLISILAASSFLHALGFPVLISCVGLAIRWQLALGLVILLLVWPTLVGLAFGLFSGGAWGEWLRRFLGANPREPTAWGYFWGQRKSAIVRAHLDDGTTMVGAFCQNSSASIPGTEDLYLEKHYQLDDERRPINLVPNSMGCWIPASRLRCVELYELQEEDGADDEGKSSHGEGRANDINRTGSQ